MQRICAEARQEFRTYPTRRKIEQLSAIPEPEMCPAQGTRSAELVIRELQSLVFSTMCANICSKLPDSSAFGNERSR